MRDDDLSAQIVVACTMTIIRDISALTVSTLDDKVLLRTAMTTINLMPEEAVVLSRLLLEASVVAKGHAVEQSVKKGPGAT